jgi:hypothetical protein
MELLLRRFYFGEKATIGKLLVNGTLECFTLEDRVRDLTKEAKVPGETAIPAGRYEVVITWSNRFQRFLPLLLNVPQFEGVRIHPGNRPDDTEGCILVGQTHGDEWVGLSRAAFADLFPKLENAVRREKIFITVLNEEQASAKEKPTTGET